MSTTTTTSTSINVNDTVNNDGNTDPNVVITEKSTGTTTTTTTPTSSGETSVAVTASGNGSIQITTDDDGTSDLGTVSTSIADTGTGAITNTADNDGNVTAAITDSGSGSITNTTDNDLAATVTISDTNKSAGGILNVTDGDSSANVNISESGSGLIGNVVDNDGGSNGLGSGNTYVTITSGSGSIGNVVDNDSAKGETVVNIIDKGLGLSQAAGSVMDNDGNTIIVGSGSSIQDISASNDANVFLNLATSTGGTYTAALQPLQLQYLNSDNVLLANNVSNVVDAGVGSDDIVATGGATSSTQAVDTFIYEGELNAANGSQQSNFSAGNGIDDTLILKMTAAEYATFLSKDSSALSTYLTKHDGHISGTQDTDSSSYTFTSLPLTISGFENILIEQVGSQNVVQLSGNKGTSISMANVLSVVSGSQLSDKITLAGVPTGASFNEGVNNGNGTWTFTLSQLSTLAYLPGSTSGTVNLYLATPDANALSYSTPLVSISVGAVSNTPPMLSLTSVSVVEDPGAISLTHDINAMATPTTDTLSYKISNVIDGTLAGYSSMTGSGASAVYTVSSLSSLTFTPAAGYFGAVIPLSVTALDTTNGTSTSGTLDITVTSKSFTVGTATASTTEDASSPISINLASVVSGNDSNNTLVFTVSADSNNIDYSLSNGVLTYQPKAGFVGTDDISFTVQEMSSSGGALSPAVSGSADVTVTAVAPKLTLTNPAPFIENTTTPLNAISLSGDISATASAGDTISSYTITTSTAGAMYGTLSDGGATGFSNPSTGVYTLSGSPTQLSTELSSLIYTPEYGFFSNSPIPFTVVANDSNGTSATHTLDVTINSYPIPATNTVSASVAEDSIQNSIRAVVGWEGAGVFLVSPNPSNDPNASYTVQGDSGNLSYTPNQNFTGTDTFTFTAAEESSDNEVSTSVQTITAHITVDPTAPNDVTQNFSDTENTVLSVTSLPTQSMSNNSGDTYAFAIVSGPQDAVGTFSLNTTTGAFTYHPVTGFSGTDSFTYTVTDTSSDKTASTTSQAVTATIAVAPTQPGNVTQSTSDPEDTVLTATLPSQSSNTGDTFTFNIVTGPQDAVVGSGTTPGTYNLNTTTGILTYDPSTGFVGADSFTYNVTDTSSDGTTSTTSLSTTFKIQVTPVAPTLSVTTPVIVAENSAATLIGGDISATAGNAGDTLNYQITGVMHGSLSDSSGFSMSGSGGSSEIYTVTTAELANLAFTPTTGFFGTVPLSVTAVDTTNNTSSAPSTLNIQVNVAPTLSLTTPVTVAEDSAATLIGGDIGATAGNSGDILDYQITNVTNGTLTDTTGITTNGLSGSAEIYTVTATELPNLEFQPSTGFFGTVPLSVTAVDTTNGTSSAAGTLNIQVKAVAPTLSVTTPVIIAENSAATLIGGDISATAGNAGDTLSYQITGVTNGSLSDSSGFSMSGSGGSSEIYTVTTAELANLAFTPTTGFFGTVPLSVTAVDTTNNASSVAGTLNIQVNVPPTLYLTTPVTVAEDSAATLIGGDISATAGTAGDILDYQITNVTNGTLTDTTGITTNGLSGSAEIYTVTATELPNLEFQPSTGFFGTVPLSVTAVDTTNGTSSAAGTLNIQVKAVAPTLSVTTPVTISENSSATFVGGDMHATAGNAGDPLDYLITGVTNGTLSDSSGFLMTSGMGSSEIYTVSATALSNLKFAPSTGFDGSTSLSVTAMDTTNGQSSSPSMITIKVTPSGLGTTSQDFSDTENTKLNGTLPSQTLSSSGNPNDTFTFNLIQGPTDDSSFTLNSNGTFSYLPNSDVAGQDKFIYTVTDTSSDGTTSTTSADVTANITIYPSQPGDATQNLSDVENATLIETLPNQSTSGISGDTFAFNLVSGPTHDSSFTLTSTGKVVYTPTTGFTGTDSFTYTVTERSTNGVETTSNDITADINVVPAYLYVANLGSNNVSVIDPVTNTLISASPISTGSGSSPYDSAYDPNNFEIYVTDSLTGSVSVINAITNMTVGSPISTGSGSGPHNILFDSYNNQIYVANIGSSSVSVINPNTNAVTNVPTGNEPEGMAFDPITDDIYVTNEASNNVSVINGATNAFVENIPVGNNPVDITYDPNNNDLYVSNQGSSSVSVIDGNTDSSENTVMGNPISVGGAPREIAYDPITNDLYVVNSAVSTISVINASSDSVSTTINVGRGPIGVVFDPNNNNIYVASSFGNNVSVIDGSTDSSENTVTSTIPLSTNNELTSIAFDPNSNNIYVVDGAQSGTVYAINTSTNAVTPITVGSFPSSITGDAPAAQDDLTFSTLPDGSTFGSGSVNNTADYSQVTVPTNDLLDVNLVSGQAYLMSAGSQVGLADTLLNFNNVIGSNNAPGGEMITVGNLTGMINGGTTAHANNMIDLSDLNGSIDLTANIPQWSNIQALNLGQNTALTINAADVQAFSPNGQLEITASTTAGATDTITTQGGFTDTHTSTTQAGHTYEIYTASIGAQTETLLIDSNIHAKIVG